MKAQNHPHIEAYFYFATTFDIYIAFEEWKESVLNYNNCVFHWRKTTNRNYRVDVISYDVWKMNKQTQFTYVNRTFVDFFIYTDTYNLKIKHDFKNMSKGVQKIVIEKTLVIVHPFRYLWVIKKCRKCQKITIIQKICMHL